MPRDSSGNYTLPLGNPVVDGTVIDVNWANPTMADIAVQLNNVITRDGLLSFTGPLFIVDGAEALPGLAFISANNTGIYRPSAGGLGFSTGGVERARIDGNISVSALSVINSMDHVVSLQYTEASNPLGEVGRLVTTGAFPLTLGTDNLERMRITPEGRVGVGLSNPTFHLQVYGTGAASGLVIQDAISGNMLFHQAMATDGRIGTIGPVPLTFYAAGAERARLTTDGGLLVNGTNSLYQANGRGYIEVNGAIDSLIGFKIGGSSRSYLWSGVDNLSLVHVPPGGSVVFSTVATERVRIDPAGRVGIGTPGPTFQLHLYGTGASSGLFIQDSASGNGLFAQSMSTDGRIGTTTAVPLVFYVGGAPKVVINSDGTVSFTGNLNVTAPYLHLTDGAYNGFLGSASALVVSGESTGFALRSEAALLFSTGGGPERARITAGGDVLIGTKVATYAFGGRGVLELNGTGSALLGLKVAEAAMGYLSHDGVDLRLMNQATGAVAFGIANVERGRFDTSGNFLVATTAAGLGAVGRGLVEINGATSAMVGFKINGIVQSYLSVEGGNLNLFHGAAGAITFSTSGTSRMAISATGNIGIGITPAFNLHVAGASPVFALQDNATGNRVFMQVNGAVDGRTGTITNIPFTLWTNSLERMNIGIDGNVGIGSAPSAAKLKVFGNYNEFTNGTFTGILGAGGSVITGGGTSDLGITSSGAILFGTTAGVERARITPAGGLNLSGGAGSLTIGGAITRYESPEQTCPGAGFQNLFVAHGGPRVPDFAIIRLRCKVAELGYPVGIEIPFYDNPSAGWSHVVDANGTATTVGALWNTPSGPMVASVAGNGATTVVTPDNWRIIFRAFWL